MGASKNSQRRKCGDIFINLKTIKNKAKVFTFHCSICSMDCDQLKKFSKHLENHLNYYENNLENGEQFGKTKIIFESEEIKVEPDMLADTSESTVAYDSAPLTEYEDALETKRIHKYEMIAPSNTDSDIIVKMETYERDSFRTACNEQINIEVENKIQFKNSIKKSKDVHVERMSNISESRKKTTQEAKETSENDWNDSSAYSKPKRRRRVIIESILPLLIKKYKHYKILWQVDDIAFGVKIKRYEIYTKIAEALKLETNKVISLDDINYHINYLNELYSKDKEQELKCKIEEKPFTPEFEYYNEMSFLSSSQGPFECSLCNEMLPKYYSFCHHIAQHNETQPFSCPSCDLMFSNYSKYLLHKKRHLGIHDFHCNVCGKGYMSKGDLEWHVTSHTGDKPYLCPICGTGFRARHGYDNHVRRHEERFRHECHICKRGFNQLQALKNHVKSHLNIRDVICTICGKGFTHRQYLKRHELIHGKEKRYKCNECGKAFFQPCGLRSHRKNHHS